MNLRARTLRSGITLALALGAGACVLPDQMNKVQTDVTDLQRRLDEIQRSQRDTQREIEALRDSSSMGGDDEVTREDIADLRMRLDNISRDLSVTDEKVNDVNRRLDRFAVDVETRGSSRGPAGGSAPETPDGALAPVPVPSSAVPEPEALYNTAYLDFSKGNFDLAISGFEEYQERYAESPLADNALYWIGECHFSKGDYDEAVRAFDRLLTRYPKSDRAAAADLKKALAFQEQNQIGQAIVQLRYVVSQYPESDEARIARDKLSALGQSPG